MRTQAPELSWELGKLCDAAKVIRPLIFEGNSELGAEIPNGFTAVKIKVDFEGDWIKYLEQAQYWIDAGYQILWGLDLGLFDQLVHPLENEEQFLDLSKKIERFSSELWSPCSASSLGAVLYSGALDISIDNEKFTEWLAERDLSLDSFNKEFLFKVSCRDFYIRYVDLLSTKLSEHCAAFVEIDVRGMSPSEQALILAKEHFEHLHLIVKGAEVPFDGLQWEANTLGAGFVGTKIPTWEAQNDVNIAILVPAEQQNSSLSIKNLASLIQAAQEIKHPYRLISEQNLIEEWHNLDYLLVSSEHLSRLGIRSLQGFVAAGGIVVSHKGDLGLEGELNLNQWEQLGEYSGRDYV